MSFVTVFILYTMAVQTAAARDHQRLIHFLLVLLTILALGALMYFGAVFLVPLAVAGLLAMVLNPLLSRLMRWKIPKGVGIAICILVFLSFFGLIALLFSIQVNKLTADWPRIEEQAALHAQELQTTIHQYFGISPEDQVTRLKSGLARAASRSGDVVGTFSNAVAKFFLVIIYTILLLAERKRIERLILQYTTSDKRDSAEKMIDTSVEMAGKYLIGQLKIIGILAVLYGLGFYFGGVPYPIFLGILAALFSIIPFLGNIIGGGLAAFLALVVSGSGAFLTVVITIVVVQLLTDYILQPLIVGNSIDLSPLATIVCIVGFATLWGPMGAILALPLTGSIQTIFKQFPALEPVAHFLGSNERRKPGTRLGRTSDVKQEIKEKKTEKA